MNADPRLTERLRYEDVRIERGVAQLRYGALDLETKWYPCGTRHDAVRQPDSTVTHLTYWFY